MKTSIVPIQWYIVNGFLKYTIENNNDRNFRSVITKKNGNGNKCCKELHCRSAILIYMTSSKREKKGNAYCIIQSFSCIFTISTMQYFLINPHPGGNEQSDREQRYT
ncbi:hypothetical protein PUN28_000713 [Cardiocondyla obscurior]|uniref:Uncharacterized protein n=1 Tax=Cardiocondyla obscurior TaxID=286306 RepID=A0AAW2H0N9_9HYME